MKDTPPLPETDFVFVIVDESMVNELVPEFALM